MLADRKKKILRAIVESFLVTGEPVGSKALMNLQGLNCSSATIRNDMADLTAGGYLTQPHTSAGRIPTVKGCRYYIDNLMPFVPIEPRLRDYIDARLVKAGDTPEKILREASSVLSEISGMAAVTTTPPSEDARIHRIRIVGIGRHTAMAIVVTTAGDVKSSLFRTSFVVTEEITAMFDLTLNKALGGAPLSQITRGFMQTLAASFKELALFLPEVLIVIMEIAEKAQVTELCISGTAKLLFMPELDPVSARGAISFLYDTKNVAKLLGKSKENRIYMGAESGYPELSGVSAITLRYTIGGTPAGSIALFAPLRADYPRLISLVKYTAEIVSSLIDELVDV
ncbi:MAG: heat-inducible transcriptional repressor HrcA [Ruminococcus sp.]|nr:heat-inducible transcriptional repressor HrcA [Ruminococcus sp.]